MPPGDAVIDELVTYLSLTPEFGGTRFGPFEGLEIRLGSDADHCHIVLPESLGVHALHLTIIRNGAQQLVLAPSERTASVFLYKRGAVHPQQITTSTAAQPGDGFALVTEDGPRFIIEAGELPPEMKAQREKKQSLAAKRLSGSALADEGKRQLWTRLLVTGPGAIVNRVYTFVRTGAILQPRYLFLGAAIGGGWILGTFGMCAAGKARSDVAAQQVQVESCEQELAFAENLTGDSTEYSFEQLAASITAVYPLGVALEEDDLLRAEVKKKAKIILTDTKQYDWLVRPRDKKAQEFADWRERVMADDAFDPDTGRLLVWLGAPPGRIRSEFLDITDSEGVEVCGRGITKMTYRQAASLGLEVQADAFVAGNYDMVRADPVARAQLLLETLNAAGQPGLPPGQFETELDPVRQGRNACLFIAGTDERTNTNRILDNLHDNLGEEAEFLPAIGSSFAPTARIAKFWAGDLARVDFTRRNPGIDFSDAPVGTVLEAYEGKGEWVLARTAEVIARAVAVPCLAVLKGDKEELAGVLGDELPTPVNCLVMDWKLRNEG